jgi:uncharacterized protein (DUF1015 family)
LFPDRDGEIVGTLRAAIEGTSPVRDFTDIRGYTHRLWRVTDREVHEHVDKCMGDRLLYLADGHHRYETALRYRDLLISRGVEVGPEALCNYVMMSLSSMQDDGLMIRPVHRLVRKVENQSEASFVDSARSYFDIEVLPYNNGGREKQEEVFLAKVKAGADQRVIGLAMKDSQAFYLLRAKENVLDDVFGNTIAAPLKKLDVTLVTKLVLERVLSFDSAALDDQQRIQYTSRADKALKAVHEGECPIALIVNSTKLDQIQAVSEAGLVMPRKSTYFYPKVMTGLVINSLQ